MRELKFRVWDGEKFLRSSSGKQDREFISLKIEGGILPQYGGRMNYHMNMVVQQYTGLKDKNGKDIYEGDIVKGICLTYGDSIAVVGLDTTFGIFYTDIDYYPTTAFSHCFSMMQEYNEVIGNIFENPELLK